LVLCLSPLAKSQTCELTDGHYEIVYDKQFEGYPSFEFRVDGDTIRELNNDHPGLFVYERMKTNNFQFKPLQNWKDSLTDLQKKLVGLGDPYYEVIDCKIDTITFINRINLHVTSHSGKMVRIK